MPASTDLAWLAGIIDGEGSLQLKAKAHAARITIRATDRRMIERAQQIATALGVRSGLHRQKPYGLGKWPVFGVEFSGRNILPLLLAVMPFLVVKGEQAAVLLEYQNLHPMARRIHFEMYRQRLLQARVPQPMAELTPTQVA